MDPNLTTETHMLYFTRMYTIQTTATAQ